MAGTFPTRDGDLRTFANDISGKISATPTVFGFSTSEAAQLAAAAAAYDAAFLLAVDPQTRTSGTVIDKDLKRELLKVTLRSFIRRIQANPAITAQQKTDLGIHVRSGQVTPQPPPNSRPVVSVVGTVNNDVVVRLIDELTPTRRARPAGVAGAAVYSYVGDVVPSDIEQWRHEALATKSECTLAYAAADAGKRITIVARWYNRKGEVGPLSAPVLTTIAAIPATPALAA